jgi:oligopeptide transport system substrate-binding protein
MATDKRFPDRLRHGLHRRSFLKGGLGLGAGAAAYALLGCGGGKEEEGATNGGNESEGELAAEQVLRIPMYEPAIAGPGSSFDTGSAFMTHSLFSTLFAYDRDRKAILADAAEYTHSDDLRVHTFKLRPDLKWSDGTPYNAHDYEWSWKYMAQHTFADVYYEGIQALQDGTGKVEDVGFKALDDLTFEVRTVNPAPFLAQNVVGRMGLHPIPRHVFEKAGDAWAQPENHVSSGPWMLQTWKHNEKIVLVRNPRYTGPPVNIDRIECTIFDELLTESEFAAFETGELDVALVPLADVQRVRNDSDLSKYTTLVEFPDQMFIHLNCSKPPFNDPRVRQALYLALDREAIANNVVLGVDKPAWLFLPPGMPGYDPDQKGRLEGDVKDAKQLLSAAGYPDGEGLRQLDFLSAGGPGSLKINEAAQSMWKENLGVDVRIKQLDLASWYVAVIAADPKSDWGDMADGYWPSDYPDPSEILPALFAENGEGAVYHHHWSDEAIRSRMLEAVYEADPEQREKKLREVDKEITAQVPGIPLIYLREMECRKPWVRGDFYFYGADFQRIRYMNILKH